LLVHLRHKETGRYWNGQNWVKSADAALAFASVTTALSYRRKHNVRDAEALISVADINAAVPLPPPPQTRHEFHEFKLFVNSASATSDRGEATLRDFCQKFLDAGRFSIEVYDVLTATDAFIQNGILATPTLLLKVGSRKSRLLGSFTVVDLFKAAVLDPSTRPLDGNPLQQVKRPRG
jgi:hypothetical protein